MRKYIEIELKETSTLTNQFLTAVVEGDCAKLFALLKEMLNNNEQFYDEFNNNPIHIIAQYGSDELVKHFLCDLEQQEHSLKAKLNPFFLELNRHDQLPFMVLDKRRENEDPLLKYLPKIQDYARQIKNTIQKETFINFIKKTHEASKTQFNPSEHTFKDIDVQQLFEGYKTPLSEQSKKNLQLAYEAMNYARKILETGENYVCITSILPFQPPPKIITPDFPQLSYLRSIKIRLQNSHTNNSGTCYDMSMLANQYLFSTSPDTIVHLVGQKNYDHVFFIIGADQRNFDITNPSSWGEDAVVGDLWSGLPPYHRSKISEMMKFSFLLMAKKYNMCLRISIPFNNDLHEFVDDNELEQVSEFVLWHYPKLGEVLTEVCSNSGVDGFNGFLKQVEEMLKNLKTAIPPVTSRFTLQKPSRAEKLQQELDEYILELKKIKDTIKPDNKNIAKFDLVWLLKTLQCFLRTEKLDKCLDIFSDFLKSPANESQNGFVAKS